MGPEILIPIALAVGIEYAYQQGHLEIAVRWVVRTATPAVRWVTENLVPESLFQTKGKARSNDDWFHEDDDF